MLLLYRWSRRWKRLNLQNLHSTMLLLYLEKSITNKVYWRIYIPLCFYFIIANNIKSGVTILFTFHYASTLSRARWALSVRSPIYIPLCFYFIDTGFCGSQRSGSFTFHYASTLSRTSFSLLFSSIQVYSLSTLFSSLDSPQKSSYPHFTKYEFPLIFQALSISQQFSAISGRQS